MHAIIVIITYRHCVISEFVSLCLYVCQTGLEKIYDLTPEC